MLVGSPRNRTAHHSSQYAARPRSAHELPKQGQHPAMKRLLRYFVQGLILTVPVVVTGYVCFGLFVRIDSWLHLSIPGAGFIVTLTAITLIGFLGPTVLSKPLVDGFEALIERLPFVRLLYHSTKDLLNAFVGEKRRFDKPVIVALSADGALRGFGFITQESLAML